MLSAAAAESGTWPEIGACAVFRSVNRLIAGGAAVSGAFIQVQTTADTSPALADAINTSAILTLMQDDAKFKETMKPVLEILQPKDDLASSIGDLCPELAKLQKDL